MREYKVRKWRSDFRPNLPFWPFRKPREIQAYIKFDESCWYDWEGDQDIKDQNKVIGITQWFGPNDKRSNMITFAPSPKRNIIEVRGYTNDRHGNWGLGEMIEIPCGDVLLAKMIFSENQVKHEFWHRAVEQKEYQMPYYAGNFCRFISGWFGGKDNSEGPFGGVASQDMKFWMTVIVDGVTIN